MEPPRLQRTPSMEQRELFKTYDSHVFDTKPTVIFLILVLCLLYGIIIEVIQEFCVLLRGAEVLDVIADLLGAILGLLFFRDFKNRITS